MVNKIIQKGVQNGSQLLFSKQKTILSGAFVIGTMLFASAVLGLIKKRLYASVITPGPELDAFFAAFRLPDLVFTLLIGGSLNAAFIPIFSHYIEKESKNKTWNFASTVLNGVVFLFVALSVLLFVFADYFALIVGSGFEPAQMELLIRLLRILMISPILLGVSSFTAGILQSFKHFLVPFFSPIVYNLGAIFGIIFLYPISGIEGAAWGVVIGSVAHLLIQLPVIKYTGFQYRFILDFKDETIRRLAKLSFPRTLGVGIEQFKTLVLINFASFLPVGSISVFDLGQSIINIPVSILGISIAQASLPQFAQLHAQGNFVTLRKTFCSSFNQILFLIIPTCVFLVVLKIPVVRLVYGAGNFSWEDTVITSWVVALLGISVFALALNALMVRLFYAVHETTLPVILALAGTIVSLIMATLSVNNLMPAISIFETVIPTNQVAGLAFAVSTGTILEFILLVYFLANRNLIDFKDFIKTPVKILISGIVMALVIRIPVKVLDQVFLDTTLVVNLVILVWLVTTVGITAYLFTTWLLGIRELQIVLKVLWKVKGMRENIEKLISSPQDIPPMPINDSNDPN